MGQPPMVSSTTPAAKEPRRHSAVDGSGNAAKVIIRTNSGIVSYGSGNSTRVVGHSYFDRVRDEEVPSTLQTDFVNHEPAVMFRDTGSTIADNESSQQRMIEHTINQGKQLFTSADTRPVDSDKTDSSPFPWAVSSLATQTPGGNASKQSAHGTSQAQESLAEVSEPRGDIAGDPNISTTSQSNMTNGTVIEDEQEIVKAVPSRVMAIEMPIEHKVSLKQSSLANADNTKAAIEKQSHSPTRRPPPTSSPQVSVPRVRVGSSNEATNRPDDDPKPSKRKASAADLEPKDSDDRAIGHPKELYRPRLSRRRATGIVEQPQDFSVIPEKATKRRRKTADTASSHPELAEDEIAHMPGIASRVEDTSKSKSLGDPAVHMVDFTTVATLPKMAEPQQPGRDEVRAALKKLNFPLTNTSFDNGMSEKPSPPKDASLLSAKKPAAVAFVSMLPPSSPALPTSPTKRLSKAAETLGMPPPSSAASRKPRRSHTTIFEDHVSLGGSEQRSPSLRQQQAARKSAALYEVKNRSTQATSRKRRSIVQDEEDDEDEDELVKDHVAEAPVPKKRGRPAKGVAAKSAVPTEEILLQDCDLEPNDAEMVEPLGKRRRNPRALAGKATSADKVLEDSEAEFDEHEIEADEPTKKRVCGRPSEAEAGGQAKHELAPTNSELNTAANVQTAAEPTYRRPSAASNSPVTPPPEKQAPPLDKQDATLPAAAQTKPAAHTPIRTSSKAIHRVGLNRKQRVQPLLKIVRPPAPAKQR